MSPWDELGRPRILVIGDLILDVYAHGAVSKANPEVPGGRVFRVDRIEYRLGGAAAVANLCVGLGAEVLLVGMAGDDEAAGKLRVELARAEVPAAIEYRGCRPTTTKSRRVDPEGRIDPVRADRESCEPIPGAMAGRLARVAIDNGPWDCVLIQDYGKGLLTGRLLAELGSRLDPRTPMFVDPARGRPWTEYPPQARIKANHDEAAGELDAAAHRHVFVTEGANGIAYRHGREGWRVPAEPVEQVVDVTGAGDTVLAVLGLCAAARKPLDRACGMAAQAAAIQVQRLGVQRISRDELAGRGPPTSTAARRLVIGLDWDGTFTADPQLGRNWLHATLNLGHRAVIVSARSDTPENRAEIAAGLGPLLVGLVPIVLSGHRPKRSVAAEEGYPVDLWIDDLPAVVDAATPDQVRELEREARF